MRRANLFPLFLAVAREGGVRQAADKVHLSQSALTRRIQELEAEVQAVLFDRTPSGMVLTKFGSVLLYHAEQMELNYRNARDELAGLHEGEGAELRVAAGPAWSYSCLPEALLRLREALPRIRISVSTRNAGSYEADLMRGKVDVVLGRLPHPDVRNERLRYEHLFQVNFRVYAGRRHSLHRQKTISPGDLSRFPWIWFDEMPTGRHVLNEYFAEAGISNPGAAVETSTIQLGLSFMRDSNYLMMLPDLVTGSSSFSDILPLAGCGPIGSFEDGLVYRDSTARMRAFDILRELLRSTDSGMASRPAERSPKA